MGGYQKGAGFLNSVERYDKNAETFELVTSMEMPEKKSHFCKNDKVQINVPLQTLEALQVTDAADDFVQLNRKLFNHEPCIQSSPLDSSTTSLPETLPVKENTNTSQSEPEVELLKLTINDENYEMGLRRNNQIYFPWTWIEPYFDVYGNINAENDTFKFYNGN